MTERFDLSSRAMQNTYDKGPFRGFPIAGRSPGEGQDNPALFRPRSIAGARVRAKVAVRWLLSR
jgi:hypothetical protein